MEVADRVALELLPIRLVTFHFRQTADTVALQTTMQRRTAQPGNGSLERIQTVVQRQQGVFAKGNNNCLFFQGKNHGSGRSRPRRKIGHRATLPPLGRSLGVDAVPVSQLSRALLTMLYRSTDRR